MVNITNSENGKSKTLPPNNQSTETTEESESASSSSEAATPDSGARSSDPDPSTLVANELAARSSRWPWMVLGLLLGALAFWGATEILERRASSTTETEAEEVELSVADVERRDLLEQVDWIGTLAYGDFVEVTGAGGTVTAATENGATLDRGDVIASVDEAPVTVMFGDRPLWRTIVDGTEGVDVKIIETNLVALGYDPDNTLTIDNEFTGNSAAMVERWQEDIGREVTGTLAPGDVVVVPGPAVITSPAEVGSSAAAAIAGISSQRDLTDVAANLFGTISNRAAIGTPVEHGTVLYEVDDEPVVALVACLLYTSPSPRDATLSRMPSSA